MSKKQSWLAASMPLLFLLLVSLWIRIYIFKVMNPVFHTDSVTFLFLEELDTVRTPGYPLFIEIVLSANDIFGFSNEYLRVICFVQIFILGMLNVWLIYKLTCLLTRNRIFAVAMGLLYNANYLVIGFEFQLMTETLSVTLLLAIIVIYLQFFKGKKLIALTAGVLMVLLIYTKPTFLLLAPFLPLATFVGFFPYSKKKKYLKKFIPTLTIFLVVIITGIFAWSLRNHIKFGYFGMSSLLPYQLRYYTNPLFEKYKPTGNKILDHTAAVYSEEVKKEGYSRGVVSFHDRLRSELGLSDAEISDAFLRVNLKLIKDYPLEFIKQVPDSLLTYYQQYSSHWTAGNTRKFLRRKGVFNYVFIKFFVFYKKLFTTPLFLVLLLIAAPLLVLLNDRKRKRSFHGWILLETVIHYMCFVSVLSTKAGVNTLRYRIPAEPLIMLVFFTALFYCVKGVARFLRKEHLRMVRKNIP